MIYNFNIISNDKFKKNELNLKITHKQNGII